MCTVDTVNNVGSEALSNPVIKQAYSFSLCRRKGSS